MKIKFHIFCFLIDYNFSQIQLKWILIFHAAETGINPLMGWESSTDTMSEIKLEFSTKDLALEYDKKNKIDFEIIESQKRKILKKSYSDNFTK